MVGGGDNGGGGCTRSGVGCVTGGNDVGGRAISKQLLLRASLIGFMFGVGVGGFFNWVGFFCLLIGGMFVVAVIFKTGSLFEKALTSSENQKQLDPQGGQGVCLNTARFAFDFLPCNSTFQTGSWRVALFVAVALLFGIGRFLVSVPDFAVRDIASYRDLPFAVSFQGTIISEPDVRSDKIYVVVEADKIWLQDSDNPQKKAAGAAQGVPGQKEYAVSGKVMLKLPRYPEYQFGDVLKLTGKLVTPGLFGSSVDSVSAPTVASVSALASPQLNNFDYAAYLSKDQLYVVSYSPKVFLVAGTGGGGPWSLLYGFKSVLSQKINNLFGEPEASLIAGILIGVRRSIPPEIVTNFNRTGLSHILAISGYNITLLINVFALFLKRRSRPARFYFTILGILFFSFLTGLSASVLRAALMGSLVCFALYSGYKSAGLNILLLSGTILVFFNPQLLLNDVSFQLSFSATLGLLIFVPILEDYLKKFPKLQHLPPFLMEGLLVTLAAQVFATPIILCNFGRFSIISPVANVLFLPLVPLLMFCSFVAIVSSFLFLPWTILWVALSWLILQILVGGVGFFASMPLASLEITWFTKDLAIVYYLAVIGFLIFYGRRKSKQYF